MAKGLQDYSVKEAVTPGISATARGADTDAFTVTRAIHCNATNPYDVTFSGDTASVKMELTKGVTYPYSIINITESGGGAVAATDITLLY